MRIDPAELVLIVVNLAAGLAGAAPLAGVLARLNGTAASVFRWYAIAVGVYVVECAAVVLGMGVPVFSVALAFVWGIALGLRLRRRAAEAAGLRASLWFSLYSSLPAASFITVPVVLLLGGWDILGVADGSRLGIPGFVPWPMNTIVGFYAACALGALACKTAITTALARQIARRCPRAAP